VSQKWTNLGYQVPGVTFLPITWLTPKSKFEAPKVNPKDADG
jgi:hypothetical protein